MRLRRSGRGAVAAWQIALLAAVLVLGAFCPAAALGAGPSVVTGGATAITGSHADLASTVTTNGNNTYCYFAVSGEGQASPSTSTPEPCAGGAFTQTVLLDGVGHYSYRALACVATNTGNDPCPAGVAALGEFKSFDAPGPTISITKVTPSATSATVSGSENPKGNFGLFTTADYSEDASFATFQTVQISNAPASGSTSTSTISATLPNLAPATTYHVRLHAFVEHGHPQDFYTETVTFRTGRYTQTLPATNVGTGGATLNGEVNAGGVSGFTYRFYYGTDAAAVDAGTSARTPDATAPATDDTLPVAVPVTGLTGNTTYHVRMEGRYTDPATSQVVTVKGDRLSFVTLAGTCPAGQVKLTNAVVPGTKLHATGCFDGTGSLAAAGPYVGHGTVVLSGLTITPAASTGTVTIDVAKRTVKTNGNAAVALGIVLLHRLDQGPVAWTFAASTSAFDIGKVNLTGRALGFPLGGALTATPEDDGGVTLKVGAFGLPSLLGDVTGIGTLTADAKGAPTSGEVSVGGAEIGPLLMPSLSLTWGGGTSWEAAADIRIPLLEQGVGATVKVTDNKLVALSVYYAAVPIPLGASGVQVDYLAASADFEPPGFEFSGSIGGVAGPEVAGISVLRLDNTFAAAVKRRAIIPSGLGDLGLPAGTDLGVLPFAFSIGGDFKLFSVIPIGGAHVYYWGVPKHPLVAAQGKAGLDLHTGDCGKLGGSAFQVKFTSQIGLAVAKDNFNLAASGSGKVRAICITLVEAGAKLRVSTVGLGMCGYINTAFGNIDGGVGAKWPKPLTASSLTKAFKPFTGCDLSAYTSNLTLNLRASASGAAPPSVVRLAGHSPSAVIRIAGRGGAPLVTVRAPDGRVATTTKGQGTVDRQNGIVVLPDDRPGQNVTYVQFARPKPGRYRIRTQPGSPTVTAISSAHQLAPARVHARVTGHGARRVLKWRSTGTAGQQLVFRELGAGGDHRILRTRRARGRVRFRPALGAKGRRRIVVDVLNHGFTRTVHTVARFRTRAPRRPGLGTVHARRSGTRVKVSWARRGGPVDHYEVRAVLGDGRKLLLRAPGRTAVLRGVAKRVGARISVTGVNALGTRGKVVSVLLKPGAAKARGGAAS